MAETPALIVISNEEAAASVRGNTQVASRKLAEQPYNISHSVDFLKAVFALQGVHQLLFGHPCVVRA